MNSVATFQMKSEKKIIVHHQDCVKGMRQLPPESISLIVTSPPYNLGIRYATYDDSGSREEYLKWIAEWAETVQSVLAADGSLFLNVGSAPRDPFIAMDVARAVSRCFVLQNTFHWIKSISIDARHFKDIQTSETAVNFGHFKPINSNRFVNDCHEFIFHFTHTGRVRIHRKEVGVPYTHKSNVTRWKSSGSDRRCRGNTWFIPYQTIQSSIRQRPHPATFPEELVERCIRLHGIRDADTVLDPFMGIGTTALTCARINICCIGYEMDAIYFSECVKRLEARFQDINSQINLNGDDDL